uniref:Lipid-binding serum glycoprotein C-terminal domain-containing protein n=2 Tax=Panagrolaimus sp. JU765 TaxID=591449 RepID=A0AC34QKS1_9BILA
MTIFNNIFIVLIVIFTFYQIVDGQSLANSFFTEPDTYAGFSSRINQKGLDLLAEYLKQRVTKFMQFGEIVYNVTLPLTPTVSMMLISQKLEGFDSSNFRSNMKMIQGQGMQWSGTPLRITIRCIYKILSSGGEVTGQVPIMFDNVGIEMSLLSGINNDGHLKTDMHKCRATVGELTFLFTPNDNELLRNYLPFIHRTVRDNIDSILCPSFHIEVVPVISNRLLNTPMSSALFDHYFINYGLIGPVKYNFESIELLHRGNVFGILRQGRTRLNDFRLPFRSSALQSTPDNKHMVTFQMSNYTIAIRDNIDSILCPLFHIEVVPVISNRLLNTPMSSALFDHYFINYGLIGPVKYNFESIELLHRGNVFGILRQGRTRLNDFRLPFRSSALQSTPDNKHMVTFQMSNYTIASLLYWMDQYRKFDYEISKTTVNDSNIAGYLRVDCGTDICAGTLFPALGKSYKNGSVTIKAHSATFPHVILQNVNDSNIAGYLRVDCGTDICAGTLFPALGKSYKNGSVTIKAHSATFPHVILQNGKIQIFVESRIDAFVQQNEQYKRFLTATMFAQISVQNLVFKDYKLTGKLVIDSFKTADVISLVDGIDEGSIEFLMNALNELLIGEDMAQKLKDGIKFPIIFDFEQSSSEIKIEKDKLIIGTDYCFDENCNRIAKNQDGNTDYYDVVQGADG